MTPEEKLFEKIRRELIDTETIKAIVGTRVYASHISTVASPEFPCISLHLVSSVADFSIPDMSYITIQVDFWFSSVDHQTDDVLECHRLVRGVLHRGELTDSSIPIQVNHCAEVGAGPMMHEQDAHLYHLPVRYRVVAI